MHELDALVEIPRATHSPLLCGMMHEGRALLARDHGDDAAFREHADRMGQYFVATGNAALVARATRLVGRALGDVAGLRRDEATVQITEDRPSAGASVTSVQTDPKER